MQIIDNQSIIEYVLFILTASIWIIIFICKWMLKKLLIYINFLKQLFKNQFFKNSTLL
jgi:hypothetical protein